MAEALRPGDPRHAGKYELLARIGSGGMGQVFLGRSPGGFPVAIKLIRAELLTANPEFRARFAREVVAARRVNALFTAPVVDADPDAEMPWLATAYVPGPSLADAVDDHGPLGASVVRALAAGLAEGLTAIHAAGVVHRDLKPSNVLLAGDGPRIIDFGISRAAEASALTMTGAFVGSPAFMSPEQAEGRLVGPPSDVFSLGSVLTFAATGNGPFHADSVPALFYQVAHAEPVLAGLPPELLPLVRQCLAKDPAQRPTPDQVIGQLGHPGSLRDWLPQQVAVTLARYDLHNLGQGLPGTGAPATAAEPTAVASPSSGVGTPATVQAAQATQDAFRPPPADPSGRYPPPGPAPSTFGPPAPQPRFPGQGYRPPPGDPSARLRPTASLARGALPAEYRFGWLALPIALFLLVAAFVAPLETLYALGIGFAATMLVSRLAAAVWWVRRRGTAGLGAAAVRTVVRDAGGTVGLLLLFFATLEFSDEVVLPAIGPGNPGNYRSALSNGQTLFSSHKQAAYFLHLFLLLTVLALALVALLRARGDLARPLALPRTARLLNSQSGRVRLAVAGAFFALTAALIAINGGLTPAKPPSGAICAIAPATCASARNVPIERTR